MVPTTIILIAVAFALAVALGIPRSHCARRPLHQDLLFAVSEGLLGSSCCIVQLGLNVFSVGCAGFAAMDAARGPARALAIGALLYRSVTESRGGRLWPLTLRGFVVCSVTALLAFTPELVQVVNQRALLQPVAVRPSVEFLVDGVKCEGCASSFLHELRTTLPETSARDVAVHFARPPAASRVVLFPAGSTSQEELLVAAQEVCSNLGYECRRHHAQDEPAQN